MNHDEDDTARLGELFGDAATIEPVAGAEAMGRRVAGVDLTAPLSPPQAEFVVGLLDRHRLVSFRDQNDVGFGPRDLERLANHFGAPVPHPKNYGNYGSGDPLELLPAERRTSTLVNQAFPDEIRCLDGADSPAVYVISNLVGSGADKDPAIGGSQHWHTDIEFEPVPLSTSMFFVHRAPTTRDFDGSWVFNPPREDGFYHPESPVQLAERREALPLNGETAYADTAAAYASLSADEQRNLDAVMVRRRFRRGEPGWLTPLVYVNPRTGRRSLHSPVWASRGARIAPVEVDGLSDDESRHFLDRLEAHCLQPDFRYDHVHRPGDVTIWDNFATLHVAPPFKRIINTPDDARLMYRMSCKGEPSYVLPRSDPDEWLSQHVTPPYRTVLG
jgi:taurine dioxygenase